MELIQSSLLPSNEFLNTTYFTSNCKAYYRFETGALTTDASGNSHTLTAISDPAEGTGKFGGGVDLDGNDAYSATDHADFKPTGNFTVGAWVKTGTTGTTQGVLQSWANVTSVRAGFVMYIGTSNVVAFQSAKNSGNTINVDYAQALSTSTVTDNNWHFCVGTWDGSNLRVYVDGTLQGTTAWTNAPAYKATNYIRVGCTNDTGSDVNFLTGSLDDVFLLNGTALTGDEISRIYGAMAYYRLESTADSKSAFTLTNLNSVGFAAGLFSNCADFGTANTNKELYYTGFPIDGGAISISAWVKVRTEIASGLWVFANEKNNTSKVSYLIRYNYNSGTRRIEFSRYKFPSTDNLGSYNVTLGTTNWNHFVLTYDGSNVNGYLNGALVAGPIASTGNGATTVIGSGLAIGSDYDAVNQSSIYADDVSVFSRALTAQEVGLIYNQGSKALFFAQY